jgi:hypothetical protein
MSQLLKSAADRYRDNDFEGKYPAVEFSIYMITCFQYNEFDQDDAIAADIFCKLVLACADHVIVEMLFRAERATGGRAELWLNENSEQALARRDIIHSRVDAKMKPLVAERVSRRLRSLI